MAALADVGVITAVLIAVAVGLVIGILPGLGGVFALSVMMPFVYDMEPVQGLAFLLAAHAVVNTGGAIPSILLGIPGTPGCAATVLDGFPLSRQGRGGYAVGAALSASAAGGVFGAIVLVASFPILQRVALLFGSPELFALTLVGLLAVAALEQGGLVAGLIAGSLGMFLATVGYQEITGVPRFWFGSDYLLDGFRLVPLLLGLFAIPEILALMQGDPVAVSPAGSRVAWREVADGMKSVVRKWWLLLHSSTVGVLVGIAPGIGGETAGFLAYALAKRAGREGDRFGTGAIEGVIAPEASNNSKEGGALVPTLAFGVPGSVGMAVLLGGFLVLGLQPGPDFLVRHMDIAIAMALVLAIANVLGVLLLLPVVGWISKVALVRGRLLAPILLVFVFAGAYSTTNHPLDVASVFLFGALGHVMKRLNYSRAALVLGFVLGPMIERYLHISLQAYGPAFLARPIVLVLEGIMFVILLWPWARRLARRARR
ncbi:MAG TPA: tripartite tricarboxylate transporter permease [Dongiaceae bacterium]|nr:tripartite tricarboxylate transporter permease [Dongiaceae bacterium]